MYTITAPLPNNLTTMVNPYRQKFDPLAAVIPLHIPLVDPFQFTLPVETLYQHLSEVGETHSPIKVFLVGWDTHQGREYQLHLPMTAGHDELIALHNHLLAGPLDYLAGKVRDYWPRVVFGRFSQQEQLEAAKQELSEFVPKFVVRIRHMELMHRQEMAQPWQLLKQFGLKATMTGRGKRKQQ